MAPPLRQATTYYRPRPVEAVQTWLAAAEISTGPLFRPDAVRWVGQGAPGQGEIGLWHERA